MTKSDFMRLVYLEDKTNKKTIKNLENIFWIGMFRITIKKEQISG